MVDVTLSIVQIGGVVLTALAFGAISSRLGFSSSIGHIAAGILLGPLMLGYLIPNEGMAPLFGEIGIMTLMFYLGLELSIKRFKERGAVATILVMAEMLASFAIGFTIAKMFGYGDLEALVIGSLLPMASTVIIAKFILEKGIMDSPEARISISSLIVEDFFAILILVVLSTMSVHGGTSLNVAVLNGVLFTIAAFFVVNKLSDPILGFLARYGQEDKMALYAIGVGILVAYFGTLLGLSSVLGAYFAGFALAETKYAERIKKELGLFREFFVLFFFVSFGSTVILPHSATVGWVLLAALPLYFISKILIYGVFGTAFGLTNESAVTCGLLMTPIGEFSLIIAAAAAPLLKAPADVTGLAFLLVISTTMVGPALYNRRGSVSKLFLRLYPKDIQHAVSTVGKRLSMVGERFGDEKALKNEHTVVIRNLFMNLVVIVSLVYISYLLDMKIDFPFMPGPSSVSVGLLLLPLIAWPIYRSLNELIFLVRRVAERTLTVAFPELASAESLAQQASEVFASLVLSIIGALACVVLYYGAPPLFLIIPGAFTVLAVMYLSKSLYGLFEQYETLDALISGESGEYREFEKQSRDFRDLHQSRLRARQSIEEALQAGDTNRARSLLSEFKRKEEKAIGHLVGSKYRLTPKQAHEAAAVGETEHTRRALEDYFRKNPPSFLLGAGKKKKR
ncbi:Glutathione-regulated potassium-efflux system protein KefB [Candidatus Norongarragalina meridionalis]|nr:Glutathione-regulated potassium-efflux system protein KefB [Candidatus Norongarragalina meridionalis]